MDNANLTILPPEYALSQEEIEILKYKMHRNYYRYSTSGIESTEIANKISEDISESHEESPLN